MQSEVLMRQLGKIQKFLPAQQVAAQFSELFTSQFETRESCSNFKKINQVFISGE
jgi:hypothetical protein